MYRCVFLVCAYPLLLVSSFEVQAGIPSSPRELSQDADSSFQAIFVVDYSVGNFVDAVSFSTNGGGEICVVDAGADKLYQWTENDNHFRFIGGKGWGNLEFDHPTDVCASFPLDIYVADYNNRRVERFDRKLNFIQSFTEENLPSSYSGSFYPRACAMSSQGELFVVESEGKRILKFDQNQNLQKEFGSYSAGAGALTDPVDIAISAGDTVFVLDVHRAIEFDIFGNYVGSIPLPVTDTALALNSVEGGVLISSASSVAAYAFDGAPVYTIRRDHIVGFPEHDEIRDALTLSSKLFILTNHTILVGNAVAGKKQ
jgi:hypothetical protein